MNEQHLEQPNNATPANDGAGEKLYTKEDVSRIIEKRLARLKVQDPSDDKLAALEERERKVTEREAALLATENRYKCIDYLNSKKFPSELADLIDTSDPERFGEKADEIMDFVGKYAAEDADGIYSLTGQMKSESPSSNEYGYFDNKPHTPKGSY